MASSQSTTTDEQSGEQPSDTRSTLAKTLAPKEVRRGDCVTLPREIAEVPSFYWCADASLAPR